MREIIDDIVNKYKYQNIEAYDKIMKLPQSMLYVKDPDNTIKLKQQKVEQAIEAGALVILNSMSREKKESPTIVIKGKTYNVTDVQFAMIKAVVLSSISCSEAIGTAFADAVSAWTDGTGEAPVEDKKSYYYAMYHAAYETLKSIINTEETTIDSVINKMAGA